MSIKNNIAWAKFVTMQHRARGIPLANEHSIRADNRMMAAQIQEQLKLLTLKSEEAQMLAQQRDKYQSLWIAAVDDVERLTKEKQK